MRLYVPRVLLIGVSVLSLSAGVMALQEGKSGNPTAAKLQNPVPSTPESIAAGAAVYKRRCVGCHGRDASGGPPKEDFLPPASNLVDDKWDHGSTDGEIFWGNDRLEQALSWAARSE